MLVVILKPPRPLVGLFLFSASELECPQRDNVVSSKSAPSASKANSLFAHFATPLF